MSVTESICVVGAGAAGLAAAWAARQLGAEVIVVDGGPGASALGGGALDLTPWETRVRAAATLGADLQNEALPPDVLAFVEAIGLWRLPRAADPVPLLATTAGRLRPARGHDRALLDLGRLRRGAHVSIVELDRPGWFASSLARTLEADPFARDRGLTFGCFEVPVCRYLDERVMSDPDLAARHDDDDRIAWLAAQLRAYADREARRARRPDAVLLGPWLGVGEPRAERLEQRLGLPAGEALTTMGSCGHRFEAARDAWLERAEVAVLRARVTKLRTQGGRTALTFEDGETREAASVVLATGGVAGGGIVYTRPDPEGQQTAAGRGAKLPFHLSFDASLPLGSGGPLGASWTGPPPHPLDVVSSLHGPDLDHAAWPTWAEPGALETVGLRTEGVKVESGVVAAGDAIAGRARTLLAAIASGLEAGRAAATSALPG